MSPYTLAEDLSQLDFVGPGDYSLLLEHFLVLASRITLYPSMTLNTVNMIKILKFTFPAWISPLNSRHHDLTAKLISLPLSLIGTSNLTCLEWNL